MTSNRAKKIKFPLPESSKVGGLESLLTVKVIGRSQAANDNMHRHAATNSASLLQSDPRKGLRFMQAVPHNSAKGDHMNWPSLPLEEWKNTCATLHMWTQIVGKIRLE